jgi:hypothetical protein
MHTRASTPSERTTAGPRPRPRRWSWLLLLLIVPSLLGLSAAPSHAQGESWLVTGVNDVGCSPGDWALAVHSGSSDDVTYTFHTYVVSGGKVYTNDETSGPALGAWDEEWQLSDTLAYGPVDNPGTWPMTPGKPMKAVFTMERPKGTIVTSWTMVAASCDSQTLLYNGPTAADLDEDYLKTPADLCPALKAFRANGCPLHDRTLTLRGKHGPKRVVGRLYSAGHPVLYAGRAVTIWKVRPGPDRKVATRTTDALGRFKARVRSGRYYATAPALLVPSAGQVTADRSTTTRVS